MKITMTGRYQTRDGWTARVLCVNAKGLQPVVALITPPDGTVEFMERFHADGVFSLIRERSGLDLIPVPEPVPIPEQETVTVPIDAEIVKRIREQGYEPVTVGSPVVGDAIVSPTSGNVVTAGTYGSWEYRIICRPIPKPTKYRTPTDDDAVGRPDAEFRDGDNRVWAKGKLVRVRNQLFPFVAELLNGDIECYAQCRIIEEAGE